jgi:Alginate export
VRTPGCRLTPLAALCIGSILSDPSRAQDLAPQEGLQTETAWSLDLGGELRERFESANNPVFGLSTPTQNDYWLHRALLSGDLQYGDDFRARLELVSGLTSSWAGSPPPTQEDPLDILQAYVDKSWSVSKAQLAMRAGRQELSLGASRLVSLRESPNVRRSFDGVRFAWMPGQERSLKAFYVRPVIPDDSTFDDRSSSDQRFWGLYATWPVAAVEGLGMDAYYLGLDRADSEFSQGVARELRHTLGVRAFGERQGWDWNIEGAWQWGSFGESSIRAWTVSFDFGFEFADLPLSPRLGLKADAISGDEDPNDRELGTFNPLFPRLPYFSEANLATPANLLDLQPNLRLALTSRLSMSLSWNGLWKHEKADAFYAPPLMPVAGTAMTQSRDIGWQASSTVEWQVTERIELDATYVSFEPHSVIRQANGRAGSFLGAWIQLKL